MTTTITMTQEERTALRIHSLKHIMSNTLESEVPLRSICSKFVTEQQELGKVVTDLEVDRIIQTFRHTDFLKEELHRLGESA